RVIDEYETFLNGKKKVSVPFKSSIKAPVKLAVDPSEKITLNLKNTPIKQVFKMLGKSNNVNFIFDKDFRDFVYTIEVEDLGFYSIMNQLCMVGSAKYRILDPASVLIYPDTTFKKRTFGLRGVKVFFLANTRAEDVKKLVMTLFRDQQILAQEDANLNSLIIKADNNTLRDIEKFIFTIDKEKAEVEIDVEILELNRNLINSIGANYGDTLSTLSAGTTDDDGTINASTNVNNLGDTNFYLTLPSAALNFLESDDSSKIISKPNLRGVDGEEIKFVVGDDIPIPQTQFQAGAGGGFANIPVTSYQYKNVGVEFKITPTIHRNNEVTVKIKLKLDYITGYKGDFPILGKRELESIIRLKEGETSIIGGFIREEIRDSVRGMPGLAKLPILGKLFGATSKGIIQTDLVFSITPRVIRKLNVTDDTNDAIWSNAQGPQGAGAAPSSPNERAGRRQPRGNSVSISPRSRRTSVNQPQFFTLRVNSKTQIARLAISGSVSGGKAEIEDVKTEFFGKDNAKIMKNASGDSFDLGYTFDTTPIKNKVVAQVKVKFLEEGSYTLSINSVSAYDKDGKQIELSTSSAEIEVKGAGAGRRPPNRARSRERD
ncbi:MAG: hypothetical protein GY950_29085, partial [bacterium]|nr:hypothetical protein [bacterium]